MSRKCSSQRCPGEFNPEIFEKSIDKHKIDAILNAPSFASGPVMGLFGSGRDASRRIPRKNPVDPSRYRVRLNSPGAFMYLRTWEERCKDIMRCELGVFFEKC